LFLITSTAVDKFVIDGAAPQQISLQCEFYFD